MTGTEWRNQGTRKNIGNMGCYLTNLKIMKGEK